MADPGDGPGGSGAHPLFLDVKIKALLKCVALFATWDQHYPPPPPPPPSLALGLDLSLDNRIFQQCFSQTALSNKHMCGLDVSFNF